MRQQMTGSVAGYDGIAPVMTALCWS